MELRLTDDLSASNLCARFVIGLPISKVTDNFSVSYAPLKIPGSVTIKTLDPATSRIELITIASDKCMRSEFPSYNVMYVN